MKGSSAETTADVRGYFEINVVDGTELTAAYVGYTPSSFTAESGNSDRGKVATQHGAARRQCLRFSHKLRRAVVADVGSDFVSHTNQANTTETLTLVCFCQQFTPKVRYGKGIQVSTLPLEPPTSTGLCNLYLIRFTIIPTL